MSDVSEAALAALIASGFDANWYQKTYPDAGMIGMNPAEHFLWIGRRLGRPPYPRGGIKHEIAGAASWGPNLCLFSHFDRDCAVDDHVLFCLERLKRAGFSTVFVSTCDLPAGEIDKVAPLAAKVVVRVNGGRDFGSWHAGLLAAGGEASAFKRMLLINDSAYGPLYDIEPMLDGMRSRFDMWGVTDSWEIEHHVQSYFLMFEQGAIESGFADAFWRSYDYETDKRRIIEKYEIGISRAARLAGLRIGSACEYASTLQAAKLMDEEHGGCGAAVRQASEGPVNPSHFFWRALVERQRCPFIKVELLRDNPSRIEDVHLWRAVLAQCCGGYDVNLISRHLLRAGALFARPQAA